MYPIPSPHQPAWYRITIKGRLDDGWSDWFDNMTIAVERTGSKTTTTTLTGRVADQAALHGLLARIRDLGLLLLSVEWIE